MKQKILEKIKQTEYGNRMFYQLKKMIGKYEVPDLTFPKLISIEVSSVCNLFCSHCPPHMKKYSNHVRSHNHIDIDLFYRIINEIDRFGERHIALHKDGEPLLHPEILEIFNRIKQNKNHVVYLTTNAHRLDQEKTDSILSNHIDVINFSIGASSDTFYKKVRGKGFAKVIQNIEAFLSSVEKSDWKPKISVQIIDLPEYQEMKDEIIAFKKFWKNHNVHVDVWKKLTWGVLEHKEQNNYRYPCYSLWNSFNINSNGIVTACCMDWRQELKIGNIQDHTIKEIWEAEELKKLRIIHVNGEENTIRACENCNYWQWQAMLLNYNL